MRNSGRHGLIGLSSEHGLGVAFEVRTPGWDFDRIGRMVYEPRERRALSASCGSAKVELCYWGMHFIQVPTISCGGSPVDCCDC